MKVFSLRIPDELKQRLADSAEDSHVSLNTYIVSALFYADSVGLSYVDFLAERSK